MPCLTTEEGSPASFIMLSLRITREALFAVIVEVERLADWIDRRDDYVRTWRTRCLDASK